GVVPVTPISASLPDGSPYIHEATAPSRALGSLTTNTGRPHAIALARPAGSVSTATAPACSACSQNVAPWCLLPGRAAYRSPRRTAAESCVIPVIPRAERASPSSPSGRRSPSMAASPVSGRTGTFRGRIAAGTGRGYLDSRGREWDVRDVPAVRRNPQRRQGEL